MRVLVLANGSAGALAGDRSDRWRDEIRGAFETHGVQADVRLAEGAELTRVAREVTGYDAVVAAGGDGTVNAVASGLYRRPVPLGVLPLGTLNHFAKDLGLPLGLEEAAGVIARGAARPVDLGSVNGQVFVNN